MKTPSLLRLVVAVLLGLGVSVAWATITVGGSTPACVNNTCYVPVLDAGSIGTLGDISAGGVLRSAAGTGTGNYPAETMASVDTTARQPASCTGTNDLSAAPFSLLANSLSTNGKGVRFHFFGTTANNVNAKTIQVVWGGQTVVTKQLTASVAGTWEVKGRCFKSGSNTQVCNASVTNYGGTTVSGTDGASVVLQAANLAGTQTDTAGIAIKVQETACTATTDITQTLQDIDFEN